MIIYFKMKRRQKNEKVEEKNMKKKTQKIKEMFK